MPRPSEIGTLFEQLQDSLRQKESTSLFVAGRPVYIYGAGNVGKDICRILKARGISVAAFLDQNAKSGATWEGTPLLKPDEETLTKAQREQSHVIIGIFKAEVEIPPLIQFLKSLGYARITSFLEFHDYFASELKDRFWLTSRHFYPERKDSIMACNALWSDDASRDLYQAILKFRFTHDYGVLPSPSPQDQYFPTDLPAWPSPLRLIDCGAYTGDTLRPLLEANSKIKLEAVAAFEPDSNNFAKLVQTVEARTANVPGPISLLPYGVSSEAKEIRFSSGQGVSSHASDEGDTVIKCVRIDDELPQFRPNLIKMDIEGAEYDALLGAQKTIEEHRPGLAICVYHQADHLWKIPLLAQKWLKGGRHYLRAHSGNNFELVYYWQP